MGLVAFGVFRCAMSCKLKEKHGFEFIQDIQLCRMKTWRVEIKFVIDFIAVNCRNNILLQTFQQKS